MSVVTVLAFYFILWWLTFFIILPIGVVTQGEANDVTLGTTESAPARPMILRKMAATTVASALILGLIYLVVEVTGFSMRDIPFVPTFRS